MGQEPRILSRRVDLRQNRIDRTLQDLDVNRQELIEQRRRSMNGIPARKRWFYVLG